MSALAAVVDWAGETSRPDVVESLLAAMDHRWEEGRSVAADGACSLAFARRPTRPREAEHAFPWRDARTSLSVVLDGRIDNREELLTALGRTRDSDASDGALLADGYARWGTSLAERLVGDFALVIWDSANRELYGARDAFGVRPLSYSTIDRRLALASEVEALLLLGSRALDDRAIAFHLLCRVSPPERTFFAGVKHLPPGHWLRARAGTISVQRFFLPPTSEVRGLGEADAARELARLLRDAVAARLLADATVLVQASGGLDSSSLACLADERRRVGAGPRLRLLSAVHPALEQEESRYQDALSRSVSSPLERFEPRRGAALGSRDLVRRSDPWRDTRIGAFQALREIARRDGAKVVLSGSGGDAVLSEMGVFRDLAANGRWAALVHELARARYLQEPRAVHLAHALKVLVPPPLRRALREFLIPSERSPWWLGDRLRAIAVGSDRGDPPTVSRLSHASAMSWAWLNGPTLLRDLDIEGATASRAGLEMRYPYLDLRVVRFVLALPYDLRLPKGPMKRLLRTALASVLPAEIRDRRDVSRLDALAGPQDPVGDNVHAIRALIEQGTWASEPYVPRAAARTILRGANAGDEAARALLWRVALLEHWLRGLG